MKRICTDPEMRFFIAKDSHEDSGFSSWCLPTTSNARHLLRRLTWTEWSYTWLAYLYDAVTALIIPNSIYAYFYPRRAIFERNKQRWRVMEGQITKACIRKDHAEQGYWKLAYLGRSSPSPTNQLTPNSVLWVGVLPEHQGKGLASRLLKWGLDQADKEDRAIYLQASQLAVGLYERHGFKVLTRPEVVSSEEKGGPLEMIIMCRDKRSERKKE